MAGNGSDLGFQGSEVTYEVCAQQNVPAKCFNICYILYIGKPTSFSVFVLHFDIDQGID